MPAPSLLLVDDSPEIGFVVQRLARKAGQTLTICHDVASAQERLRSLSPDLILLDLNLPGPNGLELCAFLRMGTEHAQTRIAFFGSAERPDDLAAALNAGVDCLFDKSLLARPDAWQARMIEIMEMAAGGEPCHLLEYSDSRMSLPLSRDGITAFNQSLQHTAVLQLGIPVVRVLLSRVLLRHCEICPNEGNPADRTGVASSWLFPDRLGLASSAFSPVYRSAAVVGCAAALSEEFARVWGFEASRAARAAVTGWMSD
jgi:CheY-like chemotaxis protein